MCRRLFSNYPLELSTTESSEWGFGHVLFVQTRNGYALIFKNEDHPMFVTQVYFRDLVTAVRKTISQSDVASG